MMFKNALIFSIDSAPEFFTEDGMSLSVFQPTGPTQQLSIGWIPPREEAGVLVENVGGILIAKAAIETRAVPGSALKKAVEAKAAAIEDQTGRRPGKKQRAELKDEALLEMLPAAFPKTLHVLVWIDPKNSRVVLDTSSTSKADIVLSLITRAFDGLRIQFLQTANAPAGMMAGWLTGEEMGSDFAAGRACTLVSTDEMKTTVRYTNAPLDTEEIQAHITSGMTVKALDVSHSAGISFTLTPALVLKGVDIDVTKQSVGSKVDAFDADVTLTTAALGRAIDDLVTALGGLIQQAAA